MLTFNPHNSLIAPSLSAPKRRFLVFRLNDWEESIKRGVECCLVTSTKVLTWNRGVAYSLPADVNTQYQHTGGLLYCLNCFVRRLFSCRLYTQLDKKEILFRMKSGHCLWDFTTVCSMLQWQGFQFINQPCVPWFISPIFLSSALIINLIRHYF